MNKYNSLSSNWLASDKWGLQVLGALCTGGAKALIQLLAAIAIGVGTSFVSPKACLLAVTIMVVMEVWHVVRTLTPIYCLHRAEQRITWSQIAFLASIGVLILVVIYVLNVGKDSPGYIILTVIGAVLGWIFQDTIKSVVAFFYLRANDLLRIGDWIEVKSHGIDGIVKRISLTMVTIENEDTTTSSFPTYILHSEHFKNNQKMTEGKTEGRQMLKTFIIDTGWIHAMSNTELDKLREILATQDKDDMEYFISHEAKAGVLNIQLYRLYLYHWLMHHSHISQAPRLIVRWLEQTPEGLPLQLYLFITDSDLTSFEWQQSQIMEHAVEALAWFNLQLYQSASGYDASNSNICLTYNPADYHKDQSNGDI